MFENYKTTIVLIQKWKLPQSISAFSSRNNWLFRYHFLNNTYQSCFLRVFLFCLCDFVLSMNWSNDLVQWNQPLTMFENCKTEIVLIHKCQLTQPISVFASRNKWFFRYHFLNKTKQSCFLRVCLFCLWLCTFHKLKKWFSSIGSTFDHIWNFQDWNWVDSEMSIIVTNKCLFQQKLVAFSLPLFEH